MFVLYTWEGYVRVHSQTFGFACNVGDRIAWHRRYFPAPVFFEVGMGVRGLVVLFRGMDNSFILEP